MPIYSRALYSRWAEFAASSTYEYQYEYWTVDADQYVNHTRGVLLQRGKREHVDFAVRISKTPHLAVSAVMTSSFYPRLSSVRRVYSFLGVRSTMDPFLPSHRWPLVDQTLVGRIPSA